MYLLLKRGSIILQILQTPYNTINMKRTRYNIPNTITVSDGSKVCAPETQVVTNPSHYNFYATPLSFKGMYNPSKIDLKSLYNGLQGTIVKGQEKGLGPKYTTNETITNALKSLITKNETINEVAKNQLTRMRAYAANFRAFLTGKDIKPVEGYSQDTEKFINELQTHLPILNKTANEAGLSPEQIDFMNDFIAQTSPTLYSMGFDDAIPHSTQVARKCMLETRKQGGTKLDILQSALVGWLHDPKFPVAYSWSNLATHPIIASSIAEETLNKPENIKSLDNLFKGNKTAATKFVNGVSEALLINNDSDFVMKNVILHKAGFMKNSEAGIADLVEGVEDIAQKRFIASQKGEVPPLFAPEMRKKMQEVSLGTGIMGVNVDKLKTAIEELSTEYPGLSSKFWQDIFYGNVSDKKLLSDAKKNLDSKGAIVELKVKGDNLFCHHKEVQNAPFAANSLIVADPMLLSPHKIISEGSQKTILGRIESYCDSFNNNVKSVPIEYSGSAKEWQKKVLTSMVKSADELTGNKNIQKANENSSLSMDEQIQKLIELIKNKETWGQYADVEPALKDSSFEKTISTISKNYNDTAESSKEMFAVS